MVIVMHVSDNFVRQVSESPALVIQLLDSKQISKPVVLYAHHIFTETQIVSM